MCSVCRRARALALNQAELEMVEGADPGGGALDADVRHR